MKTTIRRETIIEATPRTVQLAGMFDIPPMDKAALEWQVELPIEQRDWNVGLIVGPSGCGKSTVARELFAKAYMTGFNDWSPTRSVADGFPADMPVKDVTMMLSSVGFSSPPSWLRPFHVLSNGEQFRATLARALAEKPDLCVFDEFTSVVDRTVGRIGSAAVAKTVRKRKQKFIAVTCHDDVEDWLDPDWVFLPATNSFQWRLLRRRPPIDIEIRRVHHSAWKLFAPHHYLTAKLHHASRCFCGYIDGRPVAFHSYLPFVGRLRTLKRAMRGHRSVVLPDYQGVGIGNVMITRCASIYKAADYRVFRNTGHPAEIAGAQRDTSWRLIRATGLTSRDSGNGAGQKQHKFKHASARLTASFEYVGAAADPKIARQMIEEQFSAI